MKETKPESYQTHEQSPADIKQPHGYAGRRCYSVGMQWKIIAMFRLSSAASSHVYPITGELPPGVEIIPLTTHTDERGDFTEIFRNSSLSQYTPCQWNMVRSNTNVLRGVHIHRTHADYLVLASGSCTFFLFDCRTGSPLRFQPCAVDATGHAPFGLYIPPLVAHGFYFHEPSVHIYAVDHYWDTADELGVRFDDPGLGFTWPSTIPLLSERDQKLPSLQELLYTLEGPFSHGLRV